MQPQSCFVRRAVLPCEIPEILIIPGGELIASFRRRITNLPVTPTLEFDQDRLMRFVLGSIAYDKDAEFVLSHDMMEIAHSSVGMSWSADVDVVVQAAVDFGVSFVQLLRSLRAYRNGYFPYQFGDWLGMDIVLYRIDPPDPNH